MTKILRKIQRRAAFHRSTWTAKLVVRHILDKFGVRYSANGALRLTSRLNFSVRKPRPVPYNSTTKEEIEKYVNDTIKEIEAHAKRGYKVVCLDRGCPDRLSAVQTRHTAQGRARHSQDQLFQAEHQAHRCPRQGHAGHTISRKPGHRERNRVTRGAPAKVRQRLCHNGQRGGPQSREMEDYVMGTNGSVVRWFLPPYTPQQNPIEIQWREIKRAIADTFFGGFDKLQRESGRCWMPGRCPEQDCLDTCWMPWNAKRIQKRRAPRRSATLTACQNVPRHSMRDANHVRDKIHEQP